MYAARSAAAFLALLLVLSASAWAVEPQGRSILVLSPAEPLRPSVSQFVNGLQTGLDAELPGTNILVTEQVTSWEDTNGSDGVRRWFDEKYRNHDFDAIVALGPGDLDVALRLRRERWPHAKVFYALWPYGASPIQRPPDTAGIIADFIPERCVETALKLRPDIKQLFAIGGGSPGDRAFDKWIFAKIAAAYPALPITDLTGLPFREMIARSSHLPSHSAIITLTTIADVEGRPINNPRLVSAVSRVANAPIFDTLDASFGRGAVGGPLLSWERFGRELAPQLAKVFAGHDPNTLPDVVHEPFLRFDARQLRRWQIPESRLPAGAAVEFRAPTLWGQHRRLILATLLVLMLQAVLIALLLVQRRRLLASRLARSKSERALHSQEALNHAVLRSLPGYVSILDQAGKILQVNEQWSVAGADIADGFFAKTSLGADYVSCWERSFPEAHGSHSLLGRQVRSVISGETRQSALEWRFPGNDPEPRWLEIRCDVLQWPQGGVVLSHVDITERKKTEMQAERNLQTLSQFHRVAALGELAGALAHELNQPLASILINAETLEELIAREVPRNFEALEVVHEIIADDERAGQIIRKMRALLQDRDSPGIPLNLTEIAASVVKLLANEAMLRKVAVRAELAPGLPPVLGDTVQLQQVVLNLMLNAMDAVRDVMEGERTVIVATFLDHGDQVVVEVRDTGPGISSQYLPRLFDHFFTTKREGLGLGLSISRSIVDSLHGKIEAGNCATGARFRVYMPAVQVREQVPA